MTEQSEFSLASFTGLPRLVAELLNPAAAAAAAADIAEPRRADSDFLGFVSEPVGSRWNHLEITACGCISNVDHERPIDGLK